MEVSILTTAKVKSKKLREVVAAPLVRWPACSEKEDRY